MKGLRKVIGAFLCGIFSLAMLNCSCSKRSELANAKAEAKRGNSEAQFRLGAYYHDAVEVAPDYQTAALWFRRAAEQGHGGAQFALGEMYLNAEGMLPDEVQAAKWIQTAAEQGYAPAQDQLAVLYSKGIGVMQDDVEAVNWATKAAEQSYLEAQYHLGCLLSSNAPGRAPADLVAACVWLSLAAAEGDIESQELLESLQGRLTPPQLEEVKRRTDLWKQKHAVSRPQASCQQSRPWKPWTGA